MAYTTAGLSPDGSSSYYLPRLIGITKTKELMLTNRTLSAQEASQWGLVTEVVPDDRTGRTRRCSWPSKMAPPQPDPTAASSRCCWRRSATASKSRWNSRAG